MHPFRFRAATTAVTSADDLPPHHVPHGLTARQTGPAFVGHVDRTAGVWHAAAFAGGRHSRTRHPLSPTPTAIPLERRRHRRSAHPDMAASSTRPPLTGRDTVCGEALRRVRAARTFGGRRCRRLNHQVVASRMRG